MKRFILVLLAVLFVSTAAADRETYSVYTLCQPDSFVNVRMFPRKGSEIVGRLELGDEIETDGVRKNGFLHVYGFEVGEAWVNAGFVTESRVRVETVTGEIVSNGRVACRRSIKGTRRKWLVNGQKLVIYAVAGEWAITSQGFVQTRFLGCF